MEFWNFVPVPQDREALVALRRGIDAEIARRVPADLNGDGRIHGFEMLAFAKQQIARETMNDNQLIEAALTLDEDGDGCATAQGFLNAAERVFRRLEVDGDGTVSKDEIAAYRKRAPR